MQIIEWYSDPTTGKAMRRIRQEKKGEGRGGTGDHRGAFEK